MVISVNQLSLYGAAAEMCEELPVGRRAPGKPVASGQLDRQEIITQPPLAELQANVERQGNLLQEYEQRFEKLSEDQKLSRLCSEGGLRSVEVGHSSMLFHHQEEKKQITLYAERNRCLEIKKRTGVKGWIQSNVRFGPVSDVRVYNNYG